MLNGNTLSVKNENAVSIPQNSDMMSDEYKQPGIYVCEANPTFDTLQNCPVDGVFKLIVEEILGKNSRYVLQTFERHDGSMVCKRVWSPYATGTRGKAYKYITTDTLKTATITSETTTIQPNASIGINIPTNNPVGFKPLFASIGDTSVKGVFPRSCMIMTETQVTVYLDNTTSLAVEVSLRINVLYIKI